MLHAISPSVAALVSSQPATSKNAESSASAVKADPMELEFDGGAGMRSGNLSSTLQKLHLWEKKLYDEVKVCFMVDLLPFYVTFFALLFFNTCYVTRIAWRIRG